MPIRAGLVQQLLEQKLNAEQIIEELFIRGLSRQPTPEELAAMIDLVGEDASKPQPFEDILWSLLNSTEFSFNH
ncbi:MAG: hypothetical protein CMJ80_18025 [Planctomycetaceae bacterium]|nr:hypothetical protein [Planctomycetaceae bacterium]